MTEVQILPAADEQELLVMHDFAQRICDSRLASVYGASSVEYARQHFYSLRALQERQDKGLQFYLIRYMESLIGYIGVQLCPGVVCVEESYILKDFQGNKVLGGLISFLEELCKTHGLSRVRVILDSRDKRMIDLSRKLGFKLVGVRSPAPQEEWVVESWIMERQA